MRPSAQGRTIQVPRHPRRLTRFTRMPSITALKILQQPFCARSDDGGLTFGAGVPIYNLTQCSGIHGHVKVAPDGTVYVPNRGCGATQAVVVSADNGLTWAVQRDSGQHFQRRRGSVCGNRFGWDNLFRLSRRQQRASENCSLHRSGIELEPLPTMPARSSEFKIPRSRK